MEKVKTKPVYSTGLPYSENKWPSVPHETAVLSLLIPLLEPIGNHVREHLTSSKGRHRGKKSPKDSGNGDNIQPGPERPEIYSYLNIGFNSSVRILEGLIAGQDTSRSASARDQKSQMGPTDPHCPNVVFACRSALPEPVSKSLLVLIAAISHRTHDAQLIRLVELSAKAEAAISAAVGLPRVSVLTLQHGAPGANSLLNLIQDQVEPVDIPWLQETSSPMYLPVKINAAEAAIGSKKSTGKRKRTSR